MTSVFGQFEKLPTVNLATLPGGRVPPHCTRRKPTHSVFSDRAGYTQQPHPYPNSSLPNTFQAPSILTSTSRNQ